MIYLCVPNLISDSDKMVVVMSLVQQYSLYQKTRLKVQPLIDPKFADKKIDFDLFSRISSDKRFQKMN